MTKEEEKKNEIRDALKQRLKDRINGTGLSRQPLKNRENIIKKRMIKLGMTDEAESFSIDNFVRRKK